MGWQNVRLDPAGMAAVLKSAEVRSAISEIAVRVDAAVGTVEIGRDVADVVTDDYTTDRAASSVTIRHPRGRAIEARDGVLAKAAAAAGLEVRMRSS